MESVDFLLGNVDSRGQLEEYEDLREILDEGDGQVLRDYFTGGFDLRDLTKDTKANEDGPIRPGDDAQDFSDEDSLADDEGEPEKRPLNKPEAKERQVKRDEEEDPMSVDLFGPDISSVPSGQQFGADTLIALLGRDGNEEHGLVWSDEHHDGMFDDLSPAAHRVRSDEEMEESPVRERFEELQEAKKSALELVKEWFPEYSRNEILRFTEVFGAKPVELNRPQAKVPRVCVPVRLNVEAEQDERQIFKSHYPVKRPRQDFIRIKRRKLVHVEEPQSDAVPVTAKAVQQDDVGYSEAELAFLADDWEDRIVYNDVREPEASVRSLIHYTNDDLLGGEWLTSLSALVDVDSSSRELPTVLHGKVLLNMNDPNILLEEPTKRRRPSDTSPRRRGSMLSKFNVSNDAAYDAMRENLQSRIRSSSTPLNIEHSGVALRLQHPFYKTKLSKSDARAFHRPQFIIKVDHEIHLSKIHSRKKKKDRGKDIATILATSKDLSLSDNTTAVLMEFSEEYPPIMSNVGMASKLINFYRKIGVGDDTRPKLEIGETSVLDSVDKSPFGDYGHIEPGETTRVLYNKIIKAPIFPHELNANDFILMRNHTRAGGQRYFLRRMQHLFVVGQTFPIIDVPSPHSRRALYAQKARLKMIVLRVLKKIKAEGKTEGLHVRRISRHFPDQNDLQIRGRLKEFMDFKKSGQNQGHWELKFNEAIPDEEGIRSMISPETVALLDSMQAGARHLEDAGYSRTEDDEDESNLAIEQQLAPWIATRNFLDATQGKAMLKLNGEGDPTGIGEGFNFIKVSMKGGFKASAEPATPAEPVEKGKEGRSYNVAKQQKAYEDEITRIWNAQKTNLSRMEIDVEEERDYGESTADGLFDVRTPRSFDISAPSPAPSNTDTNERDEDYLSDDSQMSSLNSNRILRITRTVRTPDGGVEKKVETVTDPHVINAYIKKRRQIEAAAMTTEEIMPTSESEIDARKRKYLLEELARLKRNRDRRIARAKQIALNQNTAVAMGPPTPLGETPPSIGSPASSVPSKIKGTTFRKCSACGQVGHVKTNRQCPLYAQTAAAEGWDQR